MALGELKEITEKNPNFASAFIKMGALYYQKGEMGETEEALKDAMGAAPDSVRPRLVLSGFYLRNGTRIWRRRSWKRASRVPRTTCLSMFPWPAWP